MFLKRQLPLLITLICGIVWGVQYFIPHPASDAVYSFYTDWALVIGLFAAILGFISIIRLHSMKIKYHAKNWQFSVVTLAAMPVMIVAALLTGTESGGAFMWLYNYVEVPIEATMFSLLAFYIASAAYRAFRARSAQATALLVAAAIVMLGRVPVGAQISFWTHLFPGTSIPQVASWILNVPNMAAKRAINLGVGLGMMMVSLKIILGIERTYLGGQD